ncbi:MAG: nucleotide exchange factor GrpE [Fervidobacterium sp.]
MEFEKERKEDLENIKSNDKKVNDAEDKGEKTENTEKFEPTASENVEGINLEEENKQLKEKIADLENQLKEIQNAARIIKASFENYKLDVERQIKENTKSTVLRILRSLIPVIDDFKRAFSYYEQTKNLEEFYSGTRKIYEKFIKILENEGLKQIDASGKFDPFLHEALEREERDDVEEYTVLEVIEDGYTYNGQVIKPTKVKVAVKPKKQAG